ncbi:hypothetical protein [Oligoflexus tunisiensis]|uniref:hypothetical protein n=1 Tax=Oligoflexus tunisiensis TaxID=708132 RepID=UPI00114CBBEF|nr:hypothetical protein [Oligoflexus tunisiensis]
MNKVLLLSCFICLTAHAGTGGGISTPPGRAGLAKHLAETLGLNGSLFRMAGSDPLPLEIVVQMEDASAPAPDPVTTVTISNEVGETRNYRVTDGEAMNEYVLKDRRLTLRASLKKQP